MASIGRSSASSRFVLPLLAMLAYAGSLGAQPMPDLIAANVSGPAAATVGGSFTVSGSVLNVSPTTGAPPCFADFVLSGNPALDPPGLLIGRVQAPTIGPNGASNVIGTFPIPAGFAAGRYYVGLIADSTSLVPELVENNNGAASEAAVSVAADSSTTAPRPGIDLVAEAVFGPTPVGTNGPIALAASVRNLGDTTAGPCDVGFSLEPDPPFTNGVGLGSVRLSGLAPGARAQLQPSFMVQPGLAAGEYWLGMNVDTGFVVSESDKSNNRIASPGQIHITSVPAADLVAVALSGPATAQGGQPMLVNATIRNIGRADAPPFIAVFSASRLRTPQSEDRTLGVIWVPGIPAGKDAVLSRQLGVSYGIPAGQYYINLFADWTNFVPELDRSNNSLFSQSPFSLTTAGEFNCTPSSCADLQCTNVLVPPSARAGRAIVISGTVKNVGPVAVGPFDLTAVLSPYPRIDMVSRSPERSASTSRPTRAWPHCRRPRPREPSMSRRASPPATTTCSWERMALVPWPSPTSSISSASRKGRSPSRASTGGARACPI
ncbi:MAG: hypothetical protein HY303_01635 [Candidatus Wallbacteria bacterium]|nr:hypothetical protein [Candidatus Wallbacteria bacterium]